MAIDKLANPAAAAGAYSNTAKFISGGEGISADDGSSFKDLLRKTAVDTINTFKASDKASANAVIGKADLTDVVDAVTQAELTLQTVVAIRDRMVGAYQDIMRMPI